MATKCIPCDGKGKQTISDKSGGSVKVNCPACRGTGKKQ